MVKETGGGIGAQLRKLCGLTRPTQTVEMVLLDLEQGGFFNFKNAISDGEAGGAEPVINEDSIRRLVRDYKAGKLSLEPPMSKR